MRTVLISTLIAVQTLALSAGSALAQNIDLKNTGSANFQNLTNLNIPILISNLIKLALIVASVIFFFMLVIGGIKWILSGGDKQKTEEARNQITAALVGLVIVFSAWAISQLINALFGVNILDLDISNFRRS